MSHNIPIELDPEDFISKTLEDVYDIGANWRKSNSQPCSICRANPGEIRGHFHGSDFGRCALSVYRDMVEGKADEIIRGYSAAYLMDGHSNEREICENITMGLTELGEDAPFDILPFGNAKEHEKQVTIWVKKGGSPGKRDFRITGAGVSKLPGDEGRNYETAFRIVLHLDGILGNKEKDKAYGLEIKSVSDYTWKKIQDESKINYQWYGQMQAYMIYGHTIGFTRFYLIVKHRSTSKILAPIIIDRDDKYINTRLNVLYNIVESIRHDKPNGVVRERENSKASECMYCDHNKFCWGGNKGLIADLESGQEFNSKTRKTASVVEVAGKKLGKKKS